MKVVTEGRLRKTWEVVVVITASILLVYQVHLNIGIYLSQPTIFKVSLEPMDVIQLPPISVCPFPPFQPDKLRDFGVDVNGTYMDVERSLLSLKGIPQDTKASLLWSEAFWTLGQVIDSVSFSGKTIYYNSSVKSSPLWQRSFSPLGPCYTLLVPRNVSYIQVKLERIPDVKPCTWTAEDGTLHSYMPRYTNCSFVTELCNSSCGFEDYLHFNIKGHDSAHIYFHSTTSLTFPNSETVPDIIHFSEQLFDGSYKMVSIVNKPNPLSKAQLIESIKVKDNCILDTSYTSRDCYHQHQMERVTEAFGCLPVAKDTFSESVNLTCSSPNQIKNIAKTYKLTDVNCPSRCYTKYWTHAITDIFGTHFAFYLTADSNKLRKEQEIETYPLSQLISDTGGSLGLFLSISVFFAWKLIISLMQYLLRALDKSKVECLHYSVLMEYIGILILLTVTCTHCLVVLRTYLTQPKLTAVSLTSTAVNETSSIRSLLARRFSSRALDCQQKETLYEDHLAQCLLRDAVKEFTSLSPFINLEDLPFCEDQSLFYKSHSYVVPSEALLATTLPSKVDKCQTDLNKSGIAKVDSSLIVNINVSVNDSYYSIDVLHLICSLGGIVGLYLGFSIMQCIDFFYTHYGKQNTIKHSRFCLKSMQMMKYVIFVLGVSITMWLGLRFYLYRSFSSSVIHESDSILKTPLVLTICRWPPLDIQYLETNYGFNVSKKFLRSLPKNDRLPEVVSVLDSLDGNWSGSIEEIWQKAAWNISDVIGVSTDEKTFFLDCGDNEQVCKMMWKPAVTMLNHCFSMNTSGHNGTYSKIVVTFPRVVEENMIFGDAPQIYFAVSPQGESPLLSEMISKKPYERLIANLLPVNYKRFPNHDYKPNEKPVVYRDCVYECIYNSFAKSYGCRLPYMTKPSFGRLCNKSQYNAIPRYYKGLEIIGEKSEEDVRASKQRKNCLVSCRHLHHSFLEWSVEKLSDIYPNIEIYLHQDDIVTVTETETQTVPQLISDIGGLAGITIGFSLLLLLKIAVPRNIKETSYKKKDG